MIRDDCVDEQWADRAAASESAKASDRTGPGGIRVGLAGWYGYENVGDDLILRVLSERLRPAAIFSTKPSSAQQTGIHHVSELLDWQESLDLLLIGGGGLLNDRWLAKLPMAEFAKPYGLLSVGIPSEHWLDGLDDVLAGARFVTVRDHLALETLRRAYPQINAWWLPDPGFMLRRRRVKKRPRIVLNPRALPDAWRREEDPSDAEDLQVAALAALVERFSGRAELLAVGFEESDRALLSRLPCPGRIVAEAEAIDIIARSAILVTSRLHGGIIAATQGTEAMLIDYQDKIRGLGRLLNTRPYALTELHQMPTAMARALERRHPCDTTAPSAYGALTHRVLGLMTR